MLWGMLCHSVNLSLPCLARWDESHRYQGLHPTAMLRLCSCDRLWRGEQEACLGLLWQQICCKGEVLSNSQNMVSVHSTSHDSASPQPRQHGISYAGGKSLVSSENETNSTGRKMERHITWCDAEATIQYWSQGRPIQVPLHLWELLLPSFSQPWRSAKIK